MTAFTHKQTIFQEKAESLSAVVGSSTTKLETFRSRVQESNHAETTLRLQIVELARRCQEMEVTVSSLDKVRQTIHVLDLCPGGPSKAEFRIPVWLGHWVVGNFDTVHKSDGQIDQELNALCAQQIQLTSSPAGIGGGQPRAAEVSEIQQLTIDGAPAENTAQVPLIGTCPNCEGAEDMPELPQHASGHARICWDPGEPLTSAARRTDCSQGRKAVLCVIDRPETKQ